MRVINCIVKKVGRFDYRIILVYENGSRNELPSVMSHRTASQVRKLFRR